MQRIGNNLILYKSLGYRIQKQRKVKEWTQQTLARKAGLSGNRIHYLEKGRPMYVDELLLLASSLEVPFTDLVGETDRFKICKKY